MDLYYDAKYAKHVHTGGERGKPCEQATQRAPQGGSTRSAALESGWSKARRHTKTKTHKDANYVLSEKFETSSLLLLYNSNAHTHTYIYSTSLTEEGGKDSGVFGSVGSISTSITLAWATCVVFPAASITDFPCRCPSGSPPIAESCICAITGHP